MATDKQIAANRANAKRSTGPRTLAGKAISSHNAYRHGLSDTLRLDPLISAKINALAHALVGQQAGEHLLISAANFAQAQLQLLRVGAVRTELMAEIELSDVSSHALRRIAALDRYELYSLTMRRRAFKNLEAGKGVDK